MSGKDLGGLMGHALIFAAGAALAMAIRYFFRSKAKTKMELLIQRIKSEGGVIIQLDDMPAYAIAAKDVGNHFRNILGQSGIGIASIPFSRIYHDHGIKQLEIFRALLEDELGGEYLVGFTGRGMSAVLVVENRVGRVH